ncbi:MCE-family protein MCE3A [Mycobacterium persicum]|uniref:MCE-family protein MCE3A n=1 Tax=Mycobacterium persicum TaxID=1487726 RepID=A0A8E2LRS6_9MYCO|nr:MULTISPECIES: MCE family protein [Mycobacterium]KZS84639.1 MCE-family protein MCE3A [Mycobacterium persicum]ORB96876.1 MCE-family protein MCE3A [Mycobacterium persicum]ORC03550.1 MCE-family protein MCE3A [Mycobacterium persicum]ORC09045.1 MCE-family protein MCE3A [Mycobacterium persicum]ORC13242.1 MCE-family protein MCE3A [Mycobacterium kansasii]
MSESRSQRTHPGRWTLVLVIAIIGIVALTAALFSGSFKSSVAVTVLSDRAGLVMDRGGKVKLRGVQVGRVSEITAGKDYVTLTLAIQPEQIRYIPANVGARIRATTLFSAKYVDLVYPRYPSPQRLAAGTVLRAENVGTEVNTMFANLVKVLSQIDPAKLQGVLSALAEGLRGHGATVGQSITDANQVLLAINPRAETVRADTQAVTRLSDTYGAAAQDILKVLDAATVTSATIAAEAPALDSLLAEMIGLSRSGIALLGANKDRLITAVNLLDPTTSLLTKYHGVLTCMLVGAKIALDTGYLDATGGANGYSLIIDSTPLFGADQYRFPQNLPIVGAKGGPGGKPGCGSLPDVAANWPLRQLITNTGWGTGLDIRPNPGIAFPGYADYLPVTRGQPEPPSVRYPGGPAPGPIPYPGAPPYGAPLYAPDGTPLYPGLPPAPPPGAPREPGPPPPGSEPFVVPAPAQLQPTPAPALPREATPSP